MAVMPLDAAAQGKTTVSLAAATVGGGFQIYGDALAAVINETDTSLQVVPRATKGSAENVPLLENDQIDIALVQGEAAHEEIGRASCRERV